MPYYRYEFDTPLSPQEVADKLNAQIIKKREGLFDGFKRMMNNSQLQGTWYGTADRQGFKIRRHIDYRNSFLPMIYGTINRRARGSHIVIVMRVSIFVMVFLVMFMTPLLYTLWTATEDTIGTLSALAMLLFAVVLTGAGFGFEAQKAKALLQEQLSA